ncbi:MAG: LysR family transcriptional regulator substrate-binding protein, partial [Duodenibacillus sp.]
KVDLLFLATPEKKRIDAEFAQEELGTYRYALMASREHFPELFGKRLSLEAVNRYPIVILRPGNNTRDCLERVFAEAGLQMNVQWETETMALTEEFTKSGFGIGAMIADDQPLTHSEVPGVFELQLEAPLPGGRHFVLHRQETTLPSSAQMFLNDYRDNDVGDCAC